MAQVDVYKLDDKNSCKVAPGWGCNLFSWTVEGKELIYCPQDHPQAAVKITGGGNPLLFPSVGRTWDRSSGEPVQGVYRIHSRNKTYFMPSHGVLFFCDFHKVDEYIRPGELSVAYETSIPEKVRDENYPFNLSFTQRYTLKPGRVELETTLQNNDNTPAPAAFGYHPYFRISNSKREGVEVRLPVTKHLILTRDTVLLTGESEETDGVFRLQPDIYYDNGFGSPTGRRMSLIDANAARTVHVDFDEQFELFFLYSPDGSDFVCIEPWTRGLGAYEFLRNPGWENGELLPVLQPGEQKVYRAVFSVEWNR